MAPKQRMRIANEKASRNITMRGNVPKTTVSGIILPLNLKKHGTDYLASLVSYYDTTNPRWTIFSEKRREQISGSSMVISSLRICSLWIRYVLFRSTILLNSWLHVLHIIFICSGISNHPKHKNGLVNQCVTFFHMNLYSFVNIILYIWKEFSYVAFPCI